MFKAVTLAAVLVAAAVLHTATGTRTLHQDVVATAVVRRPTQAAGLVATAPPPPPSDLPLAPFLSCRPAKLALGEYYGIWDDSGSGANKNFASYRLLDKVSPEGQAVYKAFGSFGFSIDSNRLPQYLNDNPGKNGILCAPSKPELFRNPVRYQQVWNDEGSGANADAALWRPIPPTGYKALGDVWTYLYDPPPVDEVVVVAEELVEPCAAKSVVWNDDGSKANANLELKDADQMLSDDPVQPIGTGFQKGNTDEFFCIKKEFLKTAYITSISIINITTASLDKLTISDLPTTRDNLREEVLTNPTGNLLASEFKRTWSKSTTATLEFEKELTVGFSKTTEFSATYGSGVIGGITAGFKQGFTFKRDLRENTRTLSSDTQEQSYQIKQTVTLQPYSSVRVDAWVDVANNAEVPVDAFFLIKAEDLLTGSALGAARRAEFEQLLALNGFDGDVKTYDAARQGFVLAAKAKVKIPLGIRSSITLTCVTENNGPCQPNKNATVIDKPLVPPATP